MQEQLMKNIFRTPWIGLAILLTGLPLAAASSDEPQDVIARVGDEVIMFRDLDVTINSSAVVGIPIPQPGTRERTNMRLTLLDRQISSDLLYLDALARHMDDNPVFKSNVAQYSNTVLAMLYKQQYLIGEIPVSDEDIRRYYETNIADGTPFTQDVHMAIEAVLRKQLYKQKVAELRAHLREGLEVQVFDDEFGAAGDANRKSAEVVAVAGGEPVTWGQVRQQLTGSDSQAQRRVQLEDYIDSRIMLQKARAVGLEQDPGYLRRLNEYRKSSLVNIRRADLAEKMSPSDDDIRTYYEHNRDRIAVPEMRNIQMIVVNTREQAAEVRKKIESGQVTFFEAASEYSVDPNAKMNLGELGWVAQGSGFADLDKVTFALNPEEIGGPVESPAGWHLVKVLDVRPGQYGDIDDRDTWKQARRLLLHEREDRYIADLRTTAFPVEVYDDVFNRLTREEVNAMETAQR